MVVERWTTRDPGVSNAMLRSIRASGSFLRAPSRPPRATWTLRAAAIGVLAGAGVAVTGVPAVFGSAAPAFASAPTFGAKASATGLSINVFGTQISGGSALATVDSALQKAHAEGIGTLLTSSGAQLDDVSDASSSNTAQNAPWSCPKGGGTPAGTPLLVSIGAGCASSAASVTNAGWPVSLAQGQVGEIDVGVNGILQPVLQAGAAQLTQGLASGLGSCTSSAPAPLNQLCAGLSQAVTNLQNTVQAAGSVNQPDIVVKLGTAVSSVANAGSGGSGSYPLTANAEGESADIQLLPGVGSVAATFANGALSGVLSGAPLVEVKILPATASSTFDGTAWSSTAHSSVAVISLNIPGDVQTIDLNVPGQCQEFAAGTPLDSTVCLAAASTAANGAAQAHSVKAQLFSALPGAPGQGIQLALGDVSTTGIDAATAPAASPPAPANPPAPAQVTATSPTAVHTGVWWSGSLPMAAGAAGIGLLLIGWPKLRRLPLVARVVSRPRR